LPSRREDGAAGPAAAGFSEGAAILSAIAEGNAERDDNSNATARVMTASLGGIGDALSLGPSVSEGYSGGFDDTPVAAPVNAPAMQTPAEQTPEENGSGDPTAAVAASGNQLIDGILSGVGWSDGFITYGDPNSTGDYQAGYPSAPLTGFSQLSAKQTAAVFGGEITWDVVASIVLIVVGVILTQRA
jgi:hypothetical protein